MPPQNVSATSTKTPSLQRLTSIDAYRGMVMFLMMAEVMELGKLLKAFPDSKFFYWLNFHTTHVSWTGCSLHDMIQPSFSFLVGVSLPFSIAARRAKGSAFGLMFLHAVLRAILLVVLGIVLRSQNDPTTDFRFDDTLTQIGLGYCFLFLLAFSPLWNQALSIVIVLAGYWLLFAMWPLPAADFDYVAAGVPKDWPHLMSGFAAHWNKGSNPAAAFDHWFLKYFPFSSVYPFHTGGYATLSFIPTLATMTMGLIAGSTLEHRNNRLSKSNNIRIFLMAAAGGIMVAAGWGLDYFGICPNVKRIWTPAFTLFSGGICYVWLAALHAACDRWNLRGWAFPFLILGSNSILAYVMAEVAGDSLKELLVRHLGKGVFNICGAVWEPVFLGAAVLAVFWLILFWLRRQKVFLKI